MNAMELFSNTTTSNDFHPPVSVVSELLIKAGKPSVRCDGLKIDRS